MESQNTLNPKNAEKTKQKENQKKEQIKNREQDDRFKTNHTHNHIKSKWSEYPIEGRYFQIRFKKARLNCMLPIRNLLNIKM